MKIKPSSPALLTAGFFTFCSFFFTPCSAQLSRDTLKVMAYNTLGFSYAAGCQGAIPPLYADLKAIFQFAKPDIIGLDKMVCVQTSPTDLEGISPYRFLDTVINECFNSNYSFCPFTDISGCNDGDGSVLFYNHTKLAYLSTTPLSTGTEDIDLFKLYYTQWFGVGADTTYLYVVLCHTISGSSSTGRDSQDTTVINKLQRMFTTMPNLIYMGDFNTRSSGEPGYAYITQTNANTNFIMDDPCFHPDAKLNYPLSWQSNPNACSAELTTTTRSTTVPNSCGTTGGAMDWYDHIFLSSSLVNGTNNITYVRNSYTTVGNDGNRLGVSVNSGTNLSAPANVINALFNFSDKYPVEVTLSVKSALAVKNIQSEPGSIKVNNPVNNSIVLHFAAFMNGQNVTLDIYDICGRNLYKSAFVVNSSVINKDISLAPGVYMLHFTSGGYSTTLKVVKE